MPGTHVKVKENQLHKIILWPHTCSVCVFPPYIMSTHANNNNNITMYCQSLALMGPGEKLRKVDGASMTWGSFRLVTNIYLSSGVKCANISFSCSIPKFKTLFNSDTARGSCKYREEGSELRVPSLVTQFWLCYEEILNWLPLFSCSQGCEKWLLAALWVPLI